MICSKCKIVNPDDACFCRHCGCKLSKTIEVKNSTNNKPSKLWLFVLGSIVILLCGVIVVWFSAEVTEPSEISKIKTEVFTYYGAIEGKKPHGVGVAIYPNKDKDDRKFYFGNFDKGKRQDSTAILFYQDGSFFYGEMKNDNLNKGLLFDANNKVLFEGTFRDDKPLDGKWYYNKYFKKVEKGIETNIDDI